jgi:uncharacterized delta-60 repeat protein
MHLEMKHPLTSWPPVIRSPSRGIDCSKWKNPAFWLLVIFLVIPARAAVREVWVQRFNAPVTNSSDEAIEVAVAPNGDIIVTGTTDDHTTDKDFLTIRYSGSTGAMLWQRRHSGPANGDDVPAGLAVDAAGNVVVTGVSSSGFYTAKYAAADGALLWEQRTNGVARAVQTDQNGDVLVTGYTGSFGNYDYFTAKYAAVSGALLWAKSFTASSNTADQAVTLVLDTAGNVVVAGLAVDTGVSSRVHVIKYAGTDGAELWQYLGTNGTVRAVAVDNAGNVAVSGYVRAGNRDFYTARLSAATGQLLWEKRYNGTGSGNDEAYAVGMDADGHVIVTGFSTGNVGSTDYYTAKYSAADGTLLWENRYNGTGNSEDQPAGLVLDASGDIFVTGYSSGRTNGVSTSTDYYTAKYAGTNGALLWEQRIHAGTEEAKALALDSNGNVIVTGTLSDSGRADYYTAKYAGTNGTLLLEMRYNGLDNTGEEATAVTFSPDGNVVVTGFADAGDRRSRFYTAKYAVTNGALLWERRTADTNGARDYGRYVAVDATGNVIVTGVSYNGSNRDFYTAKYAAANGALLWDRRYDGPVLGTDEPAALAVDADGNVLVTGTSFARTNGNTTDDFYTAKYASQNGSLLWESRYNGPANSSDTATDLAVDAAGNVIVTGSSFNGNNYDFQTVKHAAANGAVLWVHRYSSTNNGNDWAAVLALDSAGNAVVAGYSFNGTNNDFYTAKYAATDGALVWEKRYNGPANNVDEVVAVDVFPSGDVVVTGMSREGTGFISAFQTIKYAAADGAMLWERRYYEPGSNGAVPSALRVDGDGNVIVTGVALRGQSQGFYTAKYAGTNGALLWDKFYDGPAGGDEVSPGSRALALGPNGSVAIAGASDGSFVRDDTFHDFITILYREVVAPRIATSPTNRLAECGLATVFTVSATGDEPLSYQWFFNGAVVGTASNLIVTASPGSAGNYFVVVTNEGGSVTSVVATLSVVDTTPPRFGLILDKIVDCAHIPIPINPPVTDDCDPSPTVTFSETSTPGGCPQSYTLTRTWTARDASGNAATGTQILTVQDVTAPVLTGQGTNKTISCPGTPIFTDPTAADDCDASPAISFLDDVAPGVGTANYTITRTWFAVDACGNISLPVSQTISIVDTAPPEFICPTNLTLDATAPAGATLVYTNMVATGCTSEVFIESVPTLGSVLPLGTHFVLWTATDLSGNSNTCEISVTVLGPRGILEDVLAELVVAQPGLTNRAEQRRLNSAIAYLTQATNAAFWIDDQHLEPATARRVFRRGKLAATKLRNILANRVTARDPGPLSDALVFGWMARLMNAKRLLAEFAVQESEELGGDPRQIAACRKLITRGDAAAIAHRTLIATTRYYEAWRRAEKIQNRLRR